MAIQPDMGAKAFNTVLPATLWYLNRDVSVRPDEMTRRRWSRYADSIPDDGLRCVLQAHIMLAEGKREEAVSLLDAAIRHVRTVRDSATYIVLGNAMLLADRMCDIKRVNSILDDAGPPERMIPELLAAYSNVMWNIGDTESAVSALRQYKKKTGNEWPTMKHRLSIAEFLKSHDMAEDYKRMKEAILSRMYEYGLTKISSVQSINEVPDGQILVERILTREPVNDDPSVSVIFETDIVEHVSPYLPDFVVFTVTQAGPDDYTD